MKPRAFSPFREKLEAIVKQFGFPQESLQIVDSIPEYCAKLGHPELETNEKRAAKCIVSNTNIPTFLLWDHVEPSDAMMPMIFRNFSDDDIRLLNDPAMFAKHQLLHEMAHFLRRESQATMHHGDREKDCDQWAFEQLKDLAGR